MERQLVWNVEDPRQWLGRLIHLSRDVALAGAAPAILDSGQTQSWDQTDFCIVHCFGSTYTRKSPHINHLQLSQPVSII